jgi:hypothetical protein
MKITLTVSKVTERGNQVVVEAEGIKGAIEFPKKGSIAESPPKPGDTIEVTLSGDKYESIKGGPVTVSGRFHGTIQGMAQSGTPARSSDFGG